MLQQAKISGANMQNASILSEQDIERLLTENTADVRIDVINRIAEAHLNRKYSLQDFVVAEQVMRILVKDTEISVRAALAARLKDNPYIPSDIILSLANDVDKVAMPILENSPVLSDHDLLAIVNSCKNIHKQAAIAGRKQISREVSEALVATRSSEVISKLAKNHGADIAPETYGKIISEYGTDREIMKAVSERPNLPPTIVEKVITLVSESLANNLRTKYDISPTIISAEAEKTRELSTLMLVDGDVSRHEIEKLVEQLHTFGRLTPSIILTSLCRGNLHFFESSLAILSNIPFQNAQTLIHDKGGLGFKALYSKAGLPDKFFMACKALLEVVADTKRGNPSLRGIPYVNEVIHGLLSRSAGKNIPNLSYIVALIRQAS